jgi:hypothetical protein
MLAMYDGSSHGAKGAAELEILVKGKATGMKNTVVGGCSNRCCGCGCFQLLYFEVLHFE